MKTPELPLRRAKSVISGVRSQIEDQQSIPSVIKASSVVRVRFQWLSLLRFLWSLMGGGSLMGRGLEASPHNSSPMSSFQTSSFGSSDHGDILTAAKWMLGKQLSVVMQRFASDKKSYCRPRYVTVRRQPPWAPWVWGTTKSALYEYTYLYLLPFWYDQKIPRRRNEKRI